MATYVIGDIQGCFDALTCLLEQAAFDPERDYLWVAGDMVNRGPDSLATLRYLKQLGDHAVVVLGNHDLHLLAIACGAKRAGKKDTLEAVLAAPDRDELLTWLRFQPLLHVSKQHQAVLVHAGLPPTWTLSQAQLLAAEVEAVLRGPKYQDFLHHMYGDQPDRWRDKLTGWPRLRLITNYLTRMRLCAADGTLNLTHNSGLDSLPDGFQPWFAHPHRQTADNTILFGHWAALEGESNANHVIALDTGCVWGGRLTMLRLDDHRFFSCACPAQPTHQATK